MAARAFAALEETSLCRIARESDGRPEVLSCFDILPAAELQLAHRRLVKRVGGEALAVRNRCHFCQSALRALSLTDRYSPIQGYDWGWSHCDKGVVELDDLAPVGLGRN